jgi:hypothetical protein
MISDLDPGDLAPGLERDHRDPVVAGDRDEAVLAVLARRRPVRTLADVGRALQPEWLVAS